MQRLAAVLAILLAVQLGGSQAKGSSAVILEAPLVCYDANPKPITINLLVPSVTQGIANVKVTKIVDSALKAIGTGQQIGETYEFTPKAPGRVAKAAFLTYTVSGANKFRASVKIKITVEKEGRGSCVNRAGATLAVANAGETLTIPASKALMRLGLTGKRFMSARLGVAGLGDSLRVTGPADNKILSYTCSVKASCAKGGLQTLALKVSNKANRTTTVASNVLVEAPPGLEGSAALYETGVTGMQQLLNLGFSEVVQAALPAEPDWVVGSVPSGRTFMVDFGGKLDTIEFHKDHNIVGSLNAPLGDGVAAGSPLLQVNSKDTPDSLEDNIGRRKLSKHGGDDDEDNDNDDSDDNNDDDDGDGGGDDDDDDSFKDDGSEVETWLENPAGVTAMGVYVSLGCGQSGNITAIFSADTDEDWDDDRGRVDDDGFEQEDDDDGRDDDDDMRHRRLLAFTTKASPAATIVTVPLRHLLKNGEDDGSDDHGHDGQEYVDDSYKYVTSVEQPEVVCDGSTPVGVWLKGYMINTSGFVRKLKIKAKLTGGASNGPAQLFIGAIYLSRSAPVELTS